MENRTTITLAAIAVVGIGAVFLAKKLAYVVENAKAIGYSAGEVAFNVADGAVAGVVTTAGSIIGIPKTNLTQCQMDMAAGRTWDASFSCPAGTFLTYIMTEKIG